MSTEEGSTPQTGDFFLVTTGSNQHLSTVPISDAPFIRFIYNVDGRIEPDETFILELTSDSALPLPTGPGAFFRQTINCTIVDGDGKMNKVKCNRLPPPNVPAVPFSLECVANVREDTLDIECIRRGGVLDTLTCSFDGLPEENC